MVDAAPGAYAHALRREILRSEQKRMRAVAIVLVCVLCVTSAAVTLLPDLQHRMFPDGIARGCRWPESVRSSCSS